MTSWQRQAARGRPPCDARGSLRRAALQAFDAGAAQFRGLARRAPNSGPEFYPRPATESTAEHDSRRDPVLAL